jgi:hypothetical protein
MKVRTILPFFFVTVLSGCATGSSGETLSSRDFSNDPAKLVFQYRQQAADMNRLADGLELEAQLYAQQGKQNSEEATRSRALVRELRADAQEADQRAQDYRRQLPHNVVN